jgi:hypothetical protein
MKASTRPTPTRPEIQAARSESSPSVGDTFCTDSSCSCTGSEPLFMHACQVAGLVSVKSPVICTLPVNSRRSCWAPTDLAVELDGELTGGAGGRRW